MLFSLYHSGAAEIYIILLKSIDIYSLIAAIMKTNKAAGINRIMELYLASDRGKYR